MTLHEIGLPDPEQFHIKEIGDKILIHRKEAGVKWNDKNKYFRSSVWEKESGKLISAGFRAFVNYGEQPDFEPLEANNRITAVTKTDGSLLCVSSYKGELIVRTRGTVDATKLSNGHEIEFLKNKYPRVFNNHYINNGRYTLLFEWTTPTNRIVLAETTEPCLWLIGMVLHDSKDEFYKYVQQEHLNTVAWFLEVERPKTYSITVSDNIEKLKKDIEPLVDIEGVVVYDESGQILKKIKTLRYLELHKVFTGVKTVDHLFDIFVEYGCTYRENFEALLATNFDWELVTTLKPLIDELYQKWQVITDKQFSIGMFIGNVDISGLSRKEKAQQILNHFPDCSGIAFAMMDGKKLTPHKLWKTFHEKSATS
jgi:hypothetical protein